MKTLWKVSNNDYTQLNRILEKYNKELKEIYRIQSKRWRDGNYERKDNRLVGQLRSTTQLIRDPKTKEIESETGEIFEDIRTELSVKLLENINTWIQEA